MGQCIHRAQMYNFCKKRLSVISALVELLETDWINWLFVFNPPIDLFCCAVNCSFISVCGVDSEFLCSLFGICCRFACCLADLNEFGGALFVRPLTFTIRPLRAQTNRSKTRVLALMFDYRNWFERKLRWRSLFSRAHNILKCYNRPRITSVFFSLFLVVVVVAY